MTTERLDTRKGLDARRMTALDLTDVELKLFLAALLGVFYVGSFLALAPSPAEPARQEPRAAGAGTQSVKTAGGARARAPRIRTRSS